MIGINTELKMVRSALQTDLTIPFLTQLQFIQKQQMSVNATWFGIAKQIHNFILTHLEHNVTILPFTFTDALYFAQVSSPVPIPRLTPLITLEKTFPIVPSFNELHLHLIKNSVEQNKTIVDNYVSIFKKIFIDWLSLKIEIPITQQKGVAPVTSPATSQTEFLFDTQLVHLHKPITNEIPSISLLTQPTYPLITNDVLNATKNTFNLSRPFMGETIKIIYNKGVVENNARLLALEIIAMNATNTANDFISLENTIKNTWGVFEKWFLVTLNTPQMITTPQMTNVFGAITCPSISPITFVPLLSWR